ncbi:MAG: nitroreductase family protein [Gammaproteobacteria bacterium]|nr:nitroreductase family protein [Gammaproteobacteria bacterium]
MNVKEAIQTRRSIKAFDSGHRMSEEEIRALVEHAILSPTAFNIQHWRFVAVRDPALRAKIREASWNQAQVTDASLLLVVCMDLKAWDKVPERYWRNAPSRVQDHMVTGIRQYYSGNEQAQRDEGMRSTSMAAMTLMLLAREMGYDSCAMDGFDFDAVGRLIHLPEDHAICMMITIGKRLQEPYPRSGQLALEEVFFTDRF